MAARKTDPASPELVVTRIVDAPRRLAFQAWTSPEHVPQWWGPRGFTAFACEMDVRPGGAWRIGMRSPEGVPIWARGVFREIVEPSRLVLSFAWEEPEGEPGRETLLRIDFTERGDKTEVTLRHGVFDSIESRDEHEEGWSGSMDRFAEFVAHQTERIEG